ncbi:hypothetical protein [Brevibacillus laterosporus]|uniref:hypothetical protein n=1 Tax=Brevibacillus laterosporus TaxID=1465 RepID=UPI003D21C47D
MANTTGKESKRSNKVLDSAIAKQKGINLLQVDAKKLLSKETEKNRVDATNNSVDIESSSSQANTSASTNPTTTTGPNTNGTAFKRPPTTLSTQEVRKMFEGFGDFYQEFATSLYQEPILKLTDQNFLDGLTVLSVFTHEFDGHPLELTSEANLTGSCTKRPLRLLFCPS